MRVLQWALYPLLVPTAQSKRPGPAIMMIPTTRPASQCPAIIPAPRVQRPGPLTPTLLVTRLLALLWMPLLKACQHSLAAELFLEMDRARATFSVEQAKLPLATTHGWPDPVCRIHPSRIKLRWDVHVLVPWTRG